MKLDKQWFYENLKPHAKNKHTPIFLDMPLSRKDFRYRLVFDWNPRKPNGDFNRIMTAQLIDTHKNVGHGKYVVPDLNFDCIENDVTTDYKLYKFLDRWVQQAFERR